MCMFSVYHDIIIISEMTASAVQYSRLLLQSPIIYLFFYDARMRPQADHAFEELIMPSKSCNDFDDNNVNNIIIISDLSACDNQPTRHTNLRDCPTSLHSPA